MVNKNTFKKSKWFQMKESLTFCNFNSVINIMTTHTVLGQVQEQMVLKVQEKALLLLRR